MGFHGNLRASGEFVTDSHFLGKRGRGFASNDSPPQAEPGDSRRFHFSIFRADSVSVTSTQLAGGDWRWRLSDQEGTVLVEAGGYCSAAQCREAVAILQTGAARATVS